MYELLEIPIKLFNPALQLFLYLENLAGDYYQIVIALTILTGFIGLYFVYKKVKLLSIILLISFVWGILGYFSVIYFNTNYVEPTQIHSLTKKDLLGKWCNKENIIKINNRYIIFNQITHKPLKEEWLLYRKIIQLKTKKLGFKNIYIVKFKKDLFLSSKIPSYNYEDLEYQKCD